MIARVNVGGGFTKTVYGEEAKEAIASENKNRANALIKIFGVNRLETEAFVSQEQNKKFAHELFMMRMPSLRIPSALILRIGEALNANAEHYALIATALGAMSSSFRSKEMTLEKFQANVDTLLTSPMFLADSCKRVKEECFRESRGYLVDFNQEKFDVIIRDRDHKTAIAEANESVRLLSDSDEIAFAREGLTRSRPLPVRDVGLIVRSYLFPEVKKAEATNEIQAASPSV